MTFTLIAIGAAALLTGALGLGIWLKGSRRAVNFRFFTATFAAAIWVAANGLVNSLADSPTGFLWGRLTFASASLIPLLFFRFSEIFPSADPPSAAGVILDRVWIVGGLAFSVISFTPLILVDTTRTDGVLSVTHGPLHLPFAAYFVGCFASAFYRLWKKLGSLSGIQRTQASYLIAGALVFACGASITNLFVPLFVGTSRYGQYGPLFSIPMIVIVGHAIIRHRLMDIRVVIKRSAVYLVAFVVAGLTLVSLLVGSNALFGDDHAVPLREILLALAVAVLFHPLKAQIQRAFDRYLYREPYDYQRIIRETSRALGRTLHLPTLLEHVGQVVHRTLRPEGIGIYLLDSEERQFSRAFPETGTGVGRDFPETLPPASALVRKVLRDRRPIFGDELGQGESGPGGGELLDEFLRLGAEVVVPLLEEDEVIGLLLVGPKRSGDPYFSDDADLLTTLANQSAVAIHNALAHQQVVRVNEEIQKILGTIDSGVIATGARGRVSLFNRAAERMTGMPSETVRGNPVGHLPAPLARLLEATLEDGQPRLHTEISLPTGTGQLVPFLCSTTPLQGSGGGTVGAVAVFSDLSRLKELEAEKRRAERLASLEAIASGMVHEIRNPLVAIKTFSQLFPQRFADAGFRESFARVSTREIARIEGLLDQFRNLASSSSQPMELIEVLGVMQATLETLQPELETRNIRLRQVTNEIVKPILGNASQLQQLFHNLCLNAIEAMGEGGELTVRVADLSQGGSILLVEISDTGSGIPDDLLPRIFDPFVSTKARGTGLGLAICRGIADAHRATLRARNNSGRPGSTFTVEFPVPNSHRADVPR